ncbi:MarP family serine protease [Nesterenkonia alkaliphila]|uniref:MarP family serine protease n=1 Tax=Nesterenkonia alkaliphila TaxID=1463631 RepID=A0A7K1UIZ8_9MICC|nr:MarP family serine protease [Nesterenkonia alkaliphila]MVT26031.1 MarP family serine protease [Nesterenkonia alkaliphila]GFZ86198.1 serine protease [Nesterenkonia alkaliphila]
MTLLDVVLVLVVIGFVAAGFARGVWATVGGAAGFLVGATAAFFAIPTVASWVPDPLWRVVAVIGAAIVLVVAGHALGSAAGAEVQRLFRSPALKTVSALIGAAVNLVVAFIVIAALSFSVQAMGFPQVNQHMKQSAVLQGIDTLMPERVEAMFADVRSTVLASDIPELAQLLVPEEPEAPQASELTEAAATVQQSVARITGVAQQCGQSQAGSGVAVGPHRVATNAHVVAGVAEPSVELPDGQIGTARVVYFNTSSDLALLAVDDIQAVAAPVGGPMEPGEAGFVMGYPSGGPFSVGSAVVQARDVSQVNNIYGSSPSELEIYQLNADVRQGNSGGPLVDQQGRVSGIVFARAMEGNSVGFAVTAEAAGQVLTAPESFTETVSTGQCVQR